MILEPIWEADFSNRSYGFRPNRSTYDAIAYLSNRLTGNGGGKFQWVIEGDIKSYFDEIPHRRLMKAQQFPLFSLLPLSPSQQNSFTVVDGFIKVKSG